MNSHIDLGQPNITKININSEHQHPEEKIICSDKASIPEKLMIEQKVEASPAEIVMPSINKDSLERKENNESIKMSMYFM
jgi:hypothetical protein